MRAQLFSAVAGYKKQHRTCERKSENHRIDGKHRKTRSGEKIDKYGDGVIVREVLQKAVPFQSRS